MFMRLLVFAILAIVGTSVYAQTNTLLTCYGVSTHQTPVIATYSVTSDGGLIEVKTQTKTTQNASAANLRYQFNILKLPTSIATSMIGDLFRAEPLANGTYRVSISMRNDNVVEEIPAAHCDSTTTDWRAKAVLPSSAMDLWKTM